MMVSELREHIVQVTYLNGGEVRRDALLVDDLTLRVVDELLDATDDVRQGSRFLAVDAGDDGRGEYADEGDPRPAGPGASENEIYEEWSEAGVKGEKLAHRAHR